MIMSGIWRTDPGRSGATTDAIHSAASAFATLALIVAAVDVVGGAAGPTGRRAARAVSTPGPCWRPPPPCSAR